MSNYLPKATATRPNPETLLRQIEADEEREKRGRLKIFLGYTSGVGKSRRMLDEGRRRHERGEDVVVGAIQSPLSPEAECLVDKMEVIPLLQREGIPMMNVGAILRRRPEVCLVDGLAFDNPPGSVHAKRWQDVEQLLEAGISVVASVNLQYIEEYRELVEKLTGKYVKETVPVAFVYKADEIEVVDLPADACQESHGDSGPVPKAARRQQHLSELREFALLLAADVVDRELEGYLHRNGIEPSWGVQERFMVFITSHADAAKMIESGRRNAERFHGELFVAYLDRPDLTPIARSVLVANLAIARQNGAQIEALDGEDTVETIMRFARAHGITQIFIEQSPKLSWLDRILGSEVDDLIRKAEGIDVRVFPL
jgi:two-component system, OmpR family, sensor histidine kinase KdpD